MNRLALIIISFLLAGMPVFAGEETRYKSELMIKGYEFNNDSLSEAIIKQDKEAVELFIKAHININIPDKEGYSALDRAIETNNKEALTIISLAGGETKKVSEEAVIIEVENNEEAAEKDKEKELIKEDKELNGSKYSADKEYKKLDKFKKTPADKKNNISKEEIDYFCELINQNNLDEAASYSEKINLNTFTKDGLAPLHYAVYNDNPAMVHLLLNLGANVNIRTDDGLTPLDIAVLNNQEIVARELIDNGGGLSSVVASELKNIGCPIIYDEMFDLYDASLDDIFKYLHKLQNKKN